MSEREKKIYRDWKHYWQEGNHGCTSAYQEFAKETWDDFEPTFNASMDDYKLAYIKLTNEQLEFRSDLVTAMLDYIKEFARPDAPKFWRWHFDRTCRREESEPVDAVPDSNADKDSNHNKD